jgi:predicted enzyme related to lactoylglutathione lyase
MSRSAEYIDKCGKIIRQHLLQMLLVGYCKVISREEIGMVTSISHISLFVPDLQGAEKFYMNLFDTELIGQEVEKENGLWFTLPFNKGWEDAKAGGIDLDMTALREGSFVLALIRSTNLSGEV